MAAYTTIDNPELHFQVKTWTGTGSSNALTLDGDEDMQPDYVMIKQRSGTQQWNGYDDLRGVQKYLGWNTTIGENTQTQGLTAFGSDGFTVGTDDMVNKSSSTYVAYCWKESATAGFDMVLYTGNGSARTISHSLSAKPDFFSVKSRTYAEQWECYSKTLGATKCLQFDDNSAEADLLNRFNDTEPTTSVFTVGDADAVNKNTYTYITYLWRSVQGFSKFGSYVANNNADGPFVYLGFRPAFLMVKSYKNAQDWEIFDNKRSTFNPVELNLAANTNGADITDLDIDFLSNGFKVRIADDSVNNSSYSYIYMAFAEQPFVNSNGVPANAR